MDWPLNNKILKNYYKLAKRSKIYIKQTFLILSIIHTNKHWYTYIINRIWKVCMWYLIKNWLLQSHDKNSRITFVDFLLELKASKIVQEFKQERNMYVTTTKILSEWCLHESWFFSLFLGAIWTAYKFLYL